jgi:hypothetical protein
MNIGSRFYAPAVLFLEKESIHCMRGWVDPRSNLTSVAKRKTLVPAGNQVPAIHLTGKSLFLNNEISISTITPTLLHESLSILF